MKKSGAMATLVLFLLMANGCATKQVGQEIHGITEDRYPKIDVIPYEKEYQEELEEVFSELSPQEDSNPSDIMRYF